jgi:hypothetical protein
MARQAAGLLTGRTRVAIVGILRRGAPLADLLQTRLAAVYGVRDCLRLELQIKRYADDLTLLYPETQLTENPTHAAINLADHTLLVVDDVMYRGHSMLRAVQYRRQTAGGNPHRGARRPWRNRAAGTHRHRRRAARRRTVGRHRMQRAPFRGELPHRPAAARTLTA